MFKEIITRTALCNIDANQYFSNIRGDSYMGDVTFLSTLRALLMNRVDKEEELQFVVSRRRVSNTLNNRELVREAIGEPEYLDNNTFFLVDLSGPVDKNKEIIGRLEKLMPERGFENLQKVRVFYKKSFEVAAFANAKKKITVVVVGNMDIRKYHYLQCATFALFPWYFNPKDGCSELERRMIEAMRQKDGDECTACYEEFASGLDFRTGKIKSAFEGFEESFFLKQKDNLTSQIRSIDSDVERYQKTIRDMLQKRRNYMMNLAGIDLGLKQANSGELVDYFLRNKNLSVVDAVGDYVYFTIDTYITDFVIDDAKPIIENSRGYIHDAIMATPDPDGTKALFKEIFTEEDPRIRIRTKAKVRIGKSGSFDSDRPIGQGLINDELNDQVQNTHICRYSCFGSEREEFFTEALSRQDHVMIVEQCIAAARNLNFNDSIVGRDFFNDLVRTNGRVFEVIETGEKMNLADAIKWVKEN